mmetsp:Transcript_26409/g.45171  ORF Transcript_26409/g.45171 Transcript_26409/m.45171 type:complete len:299 (-) Transcript_26409:73-969(-)
MRLHRSPPTPDHRPRPSRRFTRQSPPSRALRGTAREYRRSKPSPSPGASAACHAQPSKTRTQLMVTARIAKMMKRAPPTRSTVRSEIEEASSLPPMTAAPVQQACPMVAPRVTPKGSRAAPRAIVAIWERSPHSARKVRVKACSMILLIESVSFFACSSPVSEAASSSAGVSSSFFINSPSTSSSSSEAPACSMLKPSRSILTPKKRKRAPAAYCVYWRGMRSGATWPTRVERTVITASAATAPLHTTKRECRIAMMAAMKKVRSPISVAIMTPNASAKAWAKLPMRGVATGTSDASS